MIRILSILCYIAALLSAVSIAVSRWQGVAPLGCGVGDACAGLDSTRWAVIFGVVPVSLLGAFVYLAATLALFLRRARVVHLLSWTVIFSAAWFVLLQWRLGHFCFACNVTHATAVVAAVSALLTRSGEKISPAFGKSAFLAPVAALLAVSALVAVQYFGPQPATSRTFVVGSPPHQAGEAVMATSQSPLVAENGLIILFQNRNVSLDPRRLPIVHGSADWSTPPTSGVPLVFLHDWTCEHCSALHGQLDGAARTSATDLPLLIVALPAWREPDAEKVHRLMLTAWFGARPVYVAAEAALVAGKLKPTPAAVEEFLATRNGASWPDLWKNLAPSVDVIMQQGAGVLAISDSRLPLSTLPQLISGASTLVGRPTPEDFGKFLASARATSGVMDLSPTSPVTVAAPAASAASAASAGNFAAATPPTSLSSISFTKTALTLDPVHMGDSRNATFHFTNTGTEPLQIHGIQTSCGCTAVNDWPKSVAAGDSGSISITFHSAGRPLGPQVKSIAVRSSAQKSPVTSLTFAVEIIAQEPPTGNASLEAAHAPASPPPPAHPVVPSESPVRQC